MPLEVKSSAKINLTLEVLYKRKDGYHQIKTILQELQLHDTIYLEELPEGELELVCEDKSLPQGEENLAFRAAKVLKEFHAPQKGARITLIKRIPVASGLGGGSSNAAAVFKGLNRLWELSLAPERLGELGALVGSDVPFFIYGGTALAEGRGELIKPLSPFPQLHVLLAAPPGKGLSAAEVYGRLSLDKISGTGRNTDKIVELLEKEAPLGHKYPEIFFRFLCNDLEGPVFLLEKDAFLLKSYLTKKRLPSLVSGSGPTVFALSRDAGKLEETAKELSLKGCRVILTKTK